MNAKRFFFVLIGLIGLLIVITIGLVVGGNQIMAKTSQKLVDAKLNNSLADVKISEYLKAKNYLSQNPDVRAMVNNMIPKDKDQDTATKELYKIADSAGVSISSIQYPSSNLGLKATGGSTASTPAATTPSSSSSSSTPTPQAPLSQAKSVDGLAGVQGIDVDLRLTDVDKKSPVTYDSLIKFLKLVELNRRSMQIKKVFIQPDKPGNGLVKLSPQITITLFVKP
ncbi:MAG: hypothetical protein U0491_01445 [Candidatus Saccharimonadales bacterium]